MDPVVVLSTFVNLKHRSSQYEVLIYSLGLVKVSLVSWGIISSALECICWEAFSVYLWSWSF